MCSIRQKLAEEKREYDEMVSKGLRGVAYQDAVADEKNRDICKSSKNGSYEERRGPRKGDWRNYTEFEGDPLEAPEMEHEEEENDEVLEAPENRSKRNYTPDEILENISKADWNEMKKGLFPAEA